LPRSLSVELLAGLVDDDTDADPSFATTLDEGFRVGVVPPPFGAKGVDDVDAQATAAASAETNRRTATVRREERHDGAVATSPLWGARTELSWVFFIRCSSPSGTGARTRRLSPTAVLVRAAHHGRAAV
jgi:hypothetical protein